LLCYKEEIKTLLDSGTVSYENDVLKVKSQDLPSINMVNMIVYDDNGEPINFDDKFSAKLKLDVGSNLEQTCNATTRSKKGIPNPISDTKEGPSKSSLNENKKDK